MAGMSLSQNLEPKIPSWSVFVDDQEFGYTQIKTTTKSLEMKYFCNAGTIRDEFALVKS